MEDIIKQKSLPQLRDRPSLWKYLLSGVELAPRDNLLINIRN
jgi:hypothetical protein